MNRSMPLGRKDQPKQGEAQSCKRYQVRQGQAVWQVPSEDPTHERSHRNTPDIGSRCDDPGAPRRCAARPGVEIRDIGGGRSGRGAERHSGQDACRDQSG